MKTLITKLAVASILSITFVALITITSHVSRKTLAYRAATATQTQPGSEMLNGSYSNMISTLYATSGR